MQEWSEIFLENNMLEKATLTFVRDGINPDSIQLAMHT